ncbi:MAG: recombination mediator RecR [bacterium]|nr:recombination mediator RecR [bacterium]
MFPEPIKNFIEIFSKLPSIGPRLATRLAFYLANSGKNEIENLEKSIGNLKKLKTCERCFFIYTENCPVCSDENRSKDIIAIIEKENDLISLEKTGKFSGQYFILGGLAKNGELDPSQKLRLKSLAERIKKEFGGQVKEIIIALSPTTFGDFTASLIEKELKPLAQKISHLAKGVPTGGEIEFADEETLKSALEKRI